MVQKDNRPASQAIEVQLQVEPRDGALFARLTFTNRSHYPYTMLKWLAFPEGDIDSKRFEVLVDGAPARYTGILAKRAPAGPADFGTIQPGYVVTSVVNLSEAYAIPRGHAVTVTYDTISPPAGERAAPEHLRSNTVTLRS